jgi:hypothetical protein
MPSRLVLPLMILGAACAGSAAPAPAAVPPDPAPPTAQPAATADPALAIPEGRLRVAADVVRPDGRWTYDYAWSDADPSKRWLVALRRCALPAAKVCVAPPIAAPLPEIGISGFVDLEGEPRNDLAGAGVSHRLVQEPDGMKHPALWVHSSEKGKGSLLVVVDVAGGAFTKVLETTLAARDAGGSAVIRKVWLERGSGSVLDLVLLGEALPPPGVQGMPGPPLRFRHRWRDGAYHRE